MTATAEVFAFKPGDLVLVKWNDSMVYFAKIKKIDPRRRKCVVVFDDKSQDEAEFGQIHSGGFVVTCVSLTVPRRLSRPRHGESASGRPFANGSGPVSFARQRPCGPAARGLKTPCFTRHCTVGRLKGTRRQQARFSGHNSFIVLLLKLVQCARMYPCEVLIGRV